MCAACKWIQYRSGCKAPSCWRVLYQSTTDDCECEIRLVVWHLPNDTLACVHFSAPGYYHFLLYSFNCRLLQPLTQFWRNFRTIFCLCLFVFVDFLFVFFNGTSSSISNVAARQWPGPEHQNLREVSFIIASRLVLQLMVNTDYRN